MAGGIPGAWEKVTSNIKELSKLTYVTVGVVLTEQNTKQVEGIVQFAHDLGVADIRVIPAAQVSKELGSVLAHKWGSHKILDYRMKNASSGLPVRGLSVEDNPQCPLVLDDMAVCGDFHYPCIIYMREKGRPIGRFTDIKTVREERRVWYETHNCFVDPICRGNCLDVCCLMNRRWRELRGEGTSS
jgi:hypothetical protein